MRARLKSGSLVTGQLYIDLDFVPHSARTVINWSTPRPLKPIVDTGLNELADKLGDIASKLDQVPVDQISAQLLKTLQDLQETLHGTSALVGHLNDDVAPEVTAALGNARRALKAVESTLSDASPLQSDLRETLKQLSRSARTLADLSDYLEQHPESMIRGKPPDTK
jgi:paraquat-inducible protein B